MAQSTAHHKSVQQAVRPTRFDTDKQAVKQILNKPEATNQHYIFGTVSLN